MKRVTRCGWAGDKSHMIRYHDREWGKPVHRDRKHFEMLLLEGAQAGLTWDTILRKRAGYRAAFANFDPAKVSRFTAARKAALLKNPAIIRNRLKVDAAIANAAVIAVEEVELRALVGLGSRGVLDVLDELLDRKSTRLNSSHRT